MVLKKKGGGEAPPRLPEVEKTGSRASDPGSERLAIAVEAKSATHPVATVEDGVEGGNRGMASWDVGDFPQRLALAAKAEKKRGAEHGSTP